jgi:hypothetical protein
VKRRAQHRTHEKRRKSLKPVAAAATKRLSKKAEERQRQWLAAQVVVNAANLRPTNSYGTPDFVTRGYYVEFPFSCKDCGKSEVWSPTQQRWWYEVAKGDVWTVATRCRPCRRQERARRTAVREAAEAGIARKRGTGNQPVKRKAGGKD